MVLSYRKEGYCEGYCMKNSSNLVEDPWDCCECLATINPLDGSQSKGFRRCMCGQGYNDYCYTPVTNFLLSQ